MNGCDSELPSSPSKHAPRTRLAAVTSYAWNIGSSIVGFLSPSRNGKRKAEEITKQEVIDESAALESQITQGVGADTNDDENLTIVNVADEPNVTIERPRKKQNKSSSIKTDLDEPIKILEPVFNDASITIIRQSKRRNAVQSFAADLNNVGIHESKISAKPTVQGPSKKRNVPQSSENLLTSDTVILEQEVKDLDAKKRRNVTKNIKSKSNRNVKKSSRNLLKDRGIAVSQKTSSAVNPHVTRSRGYSKVPLKVVEDSPVLVVLTPEELDQINIFKMDELRATLDALETLMVITISPRPRYKTEIKELTIRMLCEWGSRLLLNNEGNAANVLNSGVCPQSIIELLNSMRP